MNNVLGLEEWDLSGVASAEQVATVSIAAAYPKLTEELLKLSPEERTAFVTQQMQTAIEAVLSLKLLINHKLLGSSGRRGRYHGLRGEVTIAALPKLAALKGLDNIRVESTNGIRISLAKPRKHKSFYCVKMTVAIQIEGRDTGMQGYEERYVLFKAYNEAEALHRAEAASTEYGEPYLNSDGQLVRWKVESLDDVYEAVLTTGSINSLDGAEVFSILKSRKNNAARAWLVGEK